MRDPRQTGYAPQPVEGITPVQRVEVAARAVPCDGEGGGGGLGEGSAARASGLRGRPGRLGVSGGRRHPRPPAARR